MFIAPLSPAVPSFIVLFTFGLAFPWNVIKGLGVGCEFTNVTAILITLISVLLGFFQGIPSIETGQSLSILLIILCFVMKSTVMPVSITNGVLAMSGLCSVFLLALCHNVQWFPVLFDTAYILGILTTVLFWIGRYLGRNEIQVSKQNTTRTWYTPGDKESMGYFYYLKFFSDVGLHGIINFAFVYMWLDTPSNLVRGLPKESVTASLIVTAAWLIITVSWYFLDRVSKMTLIHELTDAKERGDFSLFFELDNAVDILDQARNYSIFTYSSLMPLQVDREMLRSTLTKHANRLADEFVNVMDPATGSPEELFDWANQHPDNFIDFYTSQAGYIPYPFLRPDPDQHGWRSFRMAILAGFLAFMCIPVIVLGTNYLVQI